MLELDKSKHLYYNTKQLIQRGKIMKIKKLDINNDAISIILSATLFIGSITGSIVFCQYENKQQICEANTNINNNIFKGEDGKLYCYFGIGEHVIEVSRNDPYYYKTEEIEGYAIKEVEISGWKYNNKITYINTVPVVVEATTKKDGELEFNNFGTISKENNYTKKHA